MQWLPITLPLSAQFLSELSRERLEKATQWSSCYLLGGSRVSPGASGAAVGNEGCQVEAPTQFHPKLFFCFIWCAFVQDFNRRVFLFPAHTHTHTYAHLHTSLDMLHIKHLAHIRYCINIFNTYLLCSCCVARTVLAAENTAENKTNIVSVLTELTVQWACIIIKYNKG